MKIIRKKDLLREINGLKEKRDILCSVLDEFQTNQHNLNNELTRRCKIYEQRTEEHLKNYDEFIAKQKKNNAENDSILKNYSRLFDMIEAKILDSNAVFANYIGNIREDIRRLNFQQDAHNQKINCRILKKAKKNKKIKKVIKKKRKK